MHSAFWNISLIKPKSTDVGPVTNFDDCNITPIIYTQCFLVQRVMLQIFPIYFFMCMSSKNQHYQSQESEYKKCAFNFVEVTGKGHQYGCNLSDCYFVLVSQSIRAIIQYRTQLKFWNLGIFLNAVNGHRLTALKKGPV